MPSLLHYVLYILYGRINSLYAEPPKSYKKDKNNNNKEVCIM